MTLRFVDSPDRYIDGDADANNMLGVWAAAPTGPNSGNAQVITPAFGSRTGQKAFFIATNGSTGDLRANIAGAALSEVFFAFAHYCEILPDEGNTQQIRFHDSSNVVVCYINVQPTGTIVLRNSGGTIIAETAGQVVFAAQWKFFECRILTGAGSGVIQIRDATGATILDVGSLTIVGTIAILVPRGQDSGAARIGKNFFLCDISVKGIDGAFNNTWYPSGGVGNFLLRPVADVSGNEWAFVARRTFENGVGQSIGTSSNQGFSVPDAATLEIGAGAFTIEGNFRWNTLPVSAQVQHLIAKWRQTTQQSWRLYLYENGGDRFLAFEYTTGGTNSTATVVHNFPFDPVIWQKYSISVSRTGGFSRMFINGVRVGPAVANSAAYFNATSDLAVGTGGNSFSLSGPFRGWLDEVRVTVGVGRYVAEYTPSTVAFSRNVGGDPDFASVQLLVGWDNGLTIDQSSAGRAITSEGGATAFLTDDGFFGYQSIDKPSRDDTFVEAALLAARGTFELTVNPTNAQQTVVGAATYTFNTVLGSAFSILIGVDIDATISNLIAAIELGPGIGTLYGTGTTANADAAATPLPGAIASIIALIPGTVGNSIVFTTTVTGAIISGAGTLTGGVNIPAASSYVLQRLPRGITRVDSVSVFTRRSVSGVGGAEMRPGFVDAALVVSDGANAAAPANPGWQADLFSSNGANAWTIANLLGSRVRVNRTS